jgi:UDP-N-acetylglucosamine 1-carboxyvinyltransferase
LGCAVSRDGLNLTLHTKDESQVHARYDIVRTMRASICVLGPLLARRRQARVAMPGGCAFGHRPIDLHLKGLQALGGELDLEGGDIVMRCDRVQGRTIFLGGQFGSSVLATANVLCAAVLGDGTTIIESAACEPEVVNLAELLRAMGAQISGAGSPRITVNGVQELGGADHAVIPDRIAAGTYAIAAGMTNGDVILEGFPTTAFSPRSTFSNRWVFTFSRSGMNPIRPSPMSASPVIDGCRPR